MIKFEKTSNEESQWLPISDLMSVLMMVFLLIAITYMLKVNQDKKKIEQVAIEYNRLQKSLHKDLENEFRSDLKKWDAEIDSVTLSFRFKSPDILFDMGADDLKPQFKLILEDFFPRFINILHSPTYRNDIEEIRIEGHTSSYWRQNSEPEAAYIQNMALSQNRTRNVLSYTLGLPAVKSNLNWTKMLLTANGLSSSKIITDQNGVENRELSRRVEFKVKTNSEKRIATILSQ